MVLWVDLLADLKINQKWKEWNLRGEIVQKPKKSLMRKAAKQFISREAQIEPPLIECECE
jgi:hypothetical protein